MIQERYCSFEVAMLLREKGFDIPCIGRYSIHSHSKDFHLDCTRGCNNGGLFNCSAPTHQMAMDWLREIYGIDIIIEISIPSANDREYYCVIWDKHNNSYILDLFASYKDAVEASLKYCLTELI